MAPSRMPHNSSHLAGLIREAVTTPARKSYPQRQVNKTADITKVMPRIKMAAAKADDYICVCLADKFRFYNSCNNNQNNYANQYQVILQEFFQIVVSRFIIFLTLPIAFSMISAAEDSCINSPVIRLADGRTRCSRSILQAALRKSG